MLKYARKQYPETMRYIRMQNIGKLGHNVYTAFSEFITNAMNGPQYDEIMVERNRIGTKVQQMARPRPARTNDSETRHQRQSANARRRPQINFAARQMNRNASQIMVHAGDVVTNRNQTTVKERAQVECQPNVTEDLLSDQFNTWEISEPQHINEKRSLDMEPVLYVGPRQFPSPEQMPLNEDDDINLANKPAEEIVEDFFDWENVVTEGFGFDPKTIEKFSPMYCGREYVFGFIKRLVHEFLLA